MAAQYTKSELGKRLVAHAIHKIDHWAQIQFDELRYKSQYPVCIEITPNSWIVAHYELKKVQENRYTLKLNDDHVHTFYSKQSAVFYAVFNSKGYFKTGDNILKQDSKVLKFSDDVDLFKTKLYKNKKLNSFKYDLYMNRLSEAENRLKCARVELTKTIQSAKYMKVWDNIL